ncbi:MAG: hypothetical protein ISR58_10275 [Anaerolineales bacterium]|nr:hypothetical protein [Chloroflexota bacterium]MBL6981559.1 hypothetical protein [Anaerolineales bacterium]
MSNIEARNIYQLEECDELFWDNLREVSERLGWEPGQTLKACFALGWDQLNQGMNCTEKETNDDTKELE